MGSNVILLLRPVYGHLSFSLADGESAAAAAEEGRSLYDANGNIDAQVFHTELAKQAAAAQTSQQESTLQKLRQHFQRASAFVHAQLQAICVSDFNRHA